MRTREKSYCDYGFTETEAECLKVYIRGNDFVEDDLLMQCCIESMECISNLLYRSLRERLSYDKLEQEGYIPIGRDDFYGYQRKTLFLFRGKMIAEGKYSKEDGR